MSYYLEEQGVNPHSSFYNGGRIYFSVNVYEGIDSVNRIFIDLCKCFEFDVKVATAKCPVFEDNSSAIQLVNAPKMTPRLKHIRLSLFP